MADFQLSSAPAEAVRAAKFCVVDTIGAALGAHQDPQVAQVRQIFSALEPNGSPSTIWGYEAGLGMLRSAYINAMMAHTLELDDVHVRSKTHIGTVVVPAAWALVEEYGLSGARLLEAVLCGYEIMARIGMGFGVTSHRKRGWHVTATAGTFGAAAVAAKLLGLNAERTLDALGLAGTQSFGLWAFLEDGATSKVLHPAHAAMTGMESALLAKAGMTGPGHILQAKDGGLYSAMSDAPDIEAVCAGLGSAYEILALDKKVYPCCRSTHCAIDAALTLREQHGISAAEIAGIKVCTYEVGVQQCAQSQTSLNPTLPAHAKFSTPYTVALAFIEGQVTTAHFEPSHIVRPEIRALMELVQVEADEFFSARYPDHWGCKMTCTLRDGRTYTVEIPDASGSVYVPLNEEQVVRKARDTAGAAQLELSDQSIEALLDMEHLPSVEGLLF